MLGGCRQTWARLMNAPLTFGNAPKQASMAFAEHCCYHATDLSVLDVIVQCSKYWRMIISPSYDAVATNLNDIRQLIAASCVQAGRDPLEVTLVAVSKTHPADAVREAIAAGQLVFGENRVQEAASKFHDLRTAVSGLRLHVIGGLQSNKARDAVRVADCIETLDRAKLADAIADAVQREGRCPDLLVQVNVGDEAQKSGVPTAEADDFITLCQSRFGASLKGLMCIPPAEGNPSPHFDWLAARAKRHGLAVVSMGMSGDFEAAIAHGATHVRVGSAIFGHRG